MRYNIYLMKGYKCLKCGQKFRYIPRILPYCKNCLVENFEDIKYKLDEIHKRTRFPFSLPPFPARSVNGIRCGQCLRNCVIGIGEKGFCGLKKNEGGKIKHLAGKNGFFKFYRDSLPTNCVADWVCPGHKKYGFHNLAVFYESCTLNCLFCQNYHFRNLKPEQEIPLSPDVLVQAVNPQTYCVCFFGGDPSSQVMHTITAGKRLYREKNLVVCYETNGLFNPKYLRQIIEIVLSSGGYLKFDIKANSPEIYHALTGYNGSGVFKNFAYAAEIMGFENAHQNLCASTLLVPEYIDENEVFQIAKFLSDINPKIPYSLLGFGPHFYFEDTVTTSTEQAIACENKAKEAGLKRVRIGNYFLLSRL